MFKKLKLPLFLFLSLIVGTGVVLAAAQTESRLAPDLKPEVVWKGKATSLKSTENTAKGSNTFLYIYDETSLSSGLVGWDNRLFTIRLYEKDTFFNADDLVKTYVWGFKGRMINNSATITTLIPGAIESEGDSTAELYVEMDITKNSADMSGATTGSFFKYYYGIN